MYAMWEKETFPLKQNLKQKLRKKDLLKFKGQKQHKKRRVFISPPPLL